MQNAVARTIHKIYNESQTNNWCSSGFRLVDPKGIEPSNLTDANRALSQLSYGPLFISSV